MIIQRLFSKRAYKAGTKAAKAISDSATGIANKIKAKEGKAAAELSSDAVGKSKVVSKGKDGTFVQYDLRTKSKKTDKGPFIPGLMEQVEKKTKEQVQREKMKNPNYVGPKTPFVYSKGKPKRKTRFNYHERTDSGDATTKSVLTDDSSKIKIHKKEDDLFGFGKELTGISVATRNSSGKKLKRPVRMKD